MKNAIHVIDPGMMEAGGHHAALVETLIESELKDVSMSLVVHKSFDGQLAKKAETVGIVINRHFECNFYQHYEDGLELKLVGVQWYIRRLAIEYLSILKATINTADSDKVACFYPCLNWEHAFALNLALSSLAVEDKRITHKACCMFTPSESNSSNDVLYRVAFHQLSKRKGVELYASDWETKEYFSNLNIDIVDIHPCYLMPWNNIEQFRNKSEQRPQILLYMGDAKVNKGFKRLPALVRDYLSKFDGRVKLTIQFTLTWDSPELVRTIEELDRLVGEHEQLTVDKSFWSTKKVVETFNSIDAVVCSYDTDTYKNKSSGLAWLAAFFEVPMAVLGPCWLERELLRLDSPCQTSPFSNELKQIEGHGGSKRNGYFNSMFSDLLSWLLK